MDLGVWDVLVAGCLSQDGLRAVAVRNATTPGRPS